MTELEIKLAKVNGLEEEIAAQEIDHLIRKKYTLSHELSILRQKEVKPEEFAEYNTYAEECKAIIKAQFAAVE